MILQTEIVEQAIDGDRRGRFVKDVIAARDGTFPIGMVRKRLVAPPKLPARSGLTRASELESAVPCRGAVLLVHGFGQNRYTWHTSRRSFANFLAAEGYDVFNLDLRGRGRSRRFGALHDTIIDDYIREDVPAAIRTVLRVSGM